MELILQTLQHPHQRTMMYSGDYDQMASLSAGVEEFIMIL
jgi:hypothetical protein